MFHGFHRRRKKRVEQLTEQIKKLIDNPKLRYELGEAAYRRAQEFSVESITEQYIRNFEILLADNHG